MKASPLRPAIRRVLGSGKRLSARQVGAIMLANGDLTPDRCKASYFSFYNYERSKRSIGPPREGWELLERGASRIAGDNLAKMKRDGLVGREVEDGRSLWYLIDP